jgi:hypothetical protein
MQTYADRLTITLDDHQAVKEFMTRKRPGDKIKCLVEASIDEVTDKLATLSVDDVKIEEGPPPLTPEQEAMPAVRMMTERKREEDGVY